MTNQTTTRPVGASASDILALFFLIVGLGISALAQGQNTTVWGINNSNGRLYTVNFDDNTTNVINLDPNQINSGRSLAFRSSGENTGDLLLANTLGGEVLIYDAFTPGFGQVVLDAENFGSAFRPDGLDVVDSFGNLFGVSSSPGEAVPAMFWVVQHDAQCPVSDPEKCRPGGYKLPVLILDNLSDPNGVVVRSLSETLIARKAIGPVGVGDLLVLASKPAMLLLYPRQSIEDVLAGTASEQLTPVVLIPTSDFPPSAAPTGMAVAPNGELLISILDGVILRFDLDNPNPAFIDPPFASDLGAGKFKLTVGTEFNADTQEDDFKVYVTNRNGGSLLRFGIQVSGTGALQKTVTSGVEFPNDVAVSTTNTVSVELGSDVALGTTSVLQHLVEEIVIAGAASATATVIPDPRWTLAGGWVERSVTLMELGVPTLDNLDKNIAFPAFIRGLPDDSASPGVPTLIIITVDADFDVSGLVSSVGDGAQVLGVNYICNNADFTLVPQLARAADHKNDSQEVEGDFFTNISSDCGSSRGSSRELSYFAIEVSDTRRPSAIAGDQLNFLTQVMQDASSCISGSVFKKLNRKLSSALRNHSRGRFSRARNAMVDFHDLVVASPNAFSSCSDNTFGNLIARSLQIIYQLERT